MRKFIMWAVISIAVWAALYGAFALQIEGALYLIKFYVWAMLPLVCLALHPKAIEFGAQEPRKPVRSALNTAQSWVVLGCLIWFGHVVTAVAWAVCMLIALAYSTAVKSARAKSEVPA